MTGVLRSHAISMLGTGCMDLIAEFILLSPGTGWIGHRMAFTLAAFAIIVFTVAVVLSDLRL